MYYPRLDLICLLLLLCLLNYGEFFKSDFCMVRESCVSFE